MATPKRHVLDNVQCRYEEKQPSVFSVGIFDRFLACHKSGIQFTSEEVELYSKSWVKSCDTTCKLFDLVKNMKPHDTKKTLSLNEARNCIIAMSKPMGQAVQLIEINLKTIKDVKDQCKV